MKKLALLSCLIFIFGFSIQAQLDSIPINTPDTIPDKKVEQSKPEKNKSSFASKMYFGGSIGLSFGSYTRVAVYPLMGVRFNPKLRAGVQIGYEYISTSNDDYNSSFSNYGASIFAQYNIIPQIYIHVEPAYYNYAAPYTYTEDRVWVPFLFLGAGFSQRLGKSTTVYAQIKFDVLQDSNSPYSDWDPFYNVGVSIGF